MPQAPYSTKVAIRCRKCGRIIAYKLSNTSGLLQIKCPKCGYETALNLSLRKSRSAVSYRKVRPSITISIR